MNSYIWKIFLKKSKSISWIFVCSPDFAAESSRIEMFGTIGGLGFFEVIFYHPLHRVPEKNAYDIWRRSPVSALAEIPQGGLLGTKEFDQGGPRRRRGGILPEYY